jgi:WD40 repeat protein
MSIRWNIRFTLRSHYDAVRAMQFHPVEPVLITASEDGTAKLWNLGGQNAAENLKNCKKIILILL